MMRIVCISDTHEQEEEIELPEGDVLIHSGDITNRGSLFSLDKFLSWMKAQSFRHNVLIAGNHDLNFQNTNHAKSVQMCKDYGITYLQDSSTEINGMKIYGSPWQPFFCNWAFNLSRGKEIAKKWDLIPADTNILISHGPPHGILDLIEGSPSNNGRDLHQGCQDLYDRIQDLKELKLHCFGHLHLNGGKTEVHNNVIYANAAICTEEYKPTNKPVVLDI